MIRTQVQLKEEDFEGVRREASRRKCSISAFVRQSVKRALVEAEDLRGQARKAAGRSCSGTDDLARNHDAHLNHGW